MIKWIAIKLAKFYKIQSEREKRLEELFMGFYSRAATATFAPSTPRGTPAHIAIEESFGLLEYHINGRSTKDLNFKVISNDFKYRPDLVASLVIPQLLMVNTALTIDKIKKID